MLQAVFPLWYIDRHEYSNACLTGYFPPKCSRFTAFWWRQNLEWKIFRSIEEITCCFSRDLSDKIENENKNCWYMFARNQVVYLLVLCFSTCRVLTNLKTDKLEMTQNYMLFFPTEFFSSCISLITILKLNNSSFSQEKKKKTDTLSLQRVRGSAFRW